MRRFQERPILKVLYSPLGVIAVGVLALLLARSAYGVYKKEALAQERANAALYELGELTARKEKMARTVTSLENKEGMEEALREKFPVAREGEEVFVIAGQDATATPRLPQRNEGGVWAFIKSFFK